MNILKEHFNPDDFNAVEKQDIDLKVEIPLPVLMILLDYIDPDSNKLVDDIEHLYGEIETLEMEVDSLKDDIYKLENK